MNRVFEGKDKMKDSRYNSEYSVNKNGSIKQKSYSRNNYVEKKVPTSPVNAVRKGVISKENREIRNENNTKKRSSSHSHQP